jgi:hypothetical protein
MVERDQGTRAAAEGLKAALREQHAATIALTRVYNKAIDLMVEMDALQQASLSVGTTANRLSEKLGTNLEDLPGGIKIGMDHAVQFLQAGFKDVNGGMLKLAGAAKATGQNANLMIQGLASMASILPMTTEETGKLGMTILDFSVKYGTTATAMIEALKANAKAIALVGAGNTERGKQLTKAVAGLTAQAPLFKDTITQLANKLSFEEGAADVQNMLVRLGREDLAFQAMEGKITAGLLREMAAAEVKQFNMLTDGLKHSQFLKQQFSKGLSLQADQIGALEAMELSIQEGFDLATASSEEVAAHFDNSLTTQINALIGEIQVSLLPHLEKIANFVQTIVKFLVDNKFVQFLVSVGGKFLMIAGLFKVFIGAFQVFKNMIAVALKSISMPLTLLLTAAWLIYEAISFFGASTKKREDEEAMLARSKKEDKVERDTGRLSNTVTAAIMAAQMSTESAFFGEDVTFDQRERIAAAVELLAARTSGGSRSISEPN